MYKYRRLFALTLALGGILACISVRPPLIFSPHELPEAQVGELYEVTITVANNETPVFLMSVDSEALPSDLSFTYEDNQSFARITGVPEEAGTYEFSVYAYCHGTNVSGQSGEQRYELVVTGE